MLEQRTKPVLLDEKRANALRKMYSRVENPRIRVKEKCECISRTVNCKWEISAERVQRAISKHNEALIMEAVCEE
jgi:hypothetical protein